MKGRIGTHMRYKGFIVPRSNQLRKFSKKDLTSKAKTRLSWMDYFEKTHNGRLTCRHFGISPDTFYRWKRRYFPFNIHSLEDNFNNRRPHRVRVPETLPHIVSRIKTLREMYPRWGKEKIRVLLKRENLLVSSSTVGRTISRLKAKGLLKKLELNYISAKKRYLKRAWGIRKPIDFEVKKPGDIVAVDTLDVRPLPAVVRKQFTSRDLVSKWDTIRVYPSATSEKAKDFLNYLLNSSPFKVKAIQVDGGSEFKGEFEEECRNKNIRLFILPPRSPKLNGCVERSNRTHTEEFYEINDFPLEVEELNRELKEWQNTYNTIRPHEALNYLTPKEYILKQNNVYGM